MTIHFLTLYVSESTKVNRRKAIIYVLVPNFFINIVFRLPYKKKSHMIY